MKISFCIIAKDEEEALPNLLRDLRKQTVFLQPNDYEIVIICNGCTDNSANVGRAELSEQFSGTSVAYRLCDRSEAGKARSWNFAVHEILDADSDYFVFLDADIHIIDSEVIEQMFSNLIADPGSLIISGWPTKDIALKQRKTIIDWFSLKISSQTPARHAVNGSLYIGRASALRQIWLPVPTPGEDGFLTAMIHTNGFSEAARLELVQRAHRPTHYFESHSIGGFFRHERRMNIGTTINGWICEKMWAGNYTSHAGSVIRDWNLREPHWVNTLVSDKVAGQFWALPPRLMTWRLYNLRGIGIVGAIKRAPFSITATLLNIWPSIQANRALKNTNAADVW